MRSERPFKWMLLAETERCDKRGIYCLSRMYLLYMSVRSLVSCSL